MICFLLSLPDLKSILPSLPRLPGVATEQQGWTQALMDVAQS